MIDSQVLIFYAAEFNMSTQISRMCKVLVETQE